jgi:hypothetical protein
MKKDTIDEKLTRLLTDFDRMLNNHKADQTVLKRLVRLGLTPTEAKAWLRQEPNFMSSDDGYHEPQNRRRVTRTQTRNS